MKIAYIAGPYRDESIVIIGENINHAAEYAKKYWLKGYMAFCPHKNAAFFEGLVPDKVFLKGGLEFIKRMIPGKDIIVMIPGWMLSPGSHEERDLAIDLGIEIIYE
jgi:hypothetical protein